MNLSGVCSDGILKESFSKISRLNASCYLVIVHRANVVSFPIMGAGYVSPLGDICVAPYRRLSWHGTIRL